MFNTLNLSEGIMKALNKKGFTIPTEIQNRCIPLIQEGKDLVGRSKTGSGKTFAFALPAIDKINTNINAVQILIICPTRELAIQVTDEIRSATEYKENCKVVPVFGGADITRQIKTIKNAKIVVGTPGRLMDHLRRHTLKLDNIIMVILDEADEMLNMGFKEDIESILKHIDKPHQTVMFSATMPPAIKAITRNYMSDPEYIEIGDLNTTIETIEQSYISVSRTGKKEALIGLINSLNISRAIIFCNTKKMVDDINKLFYSEGINALALHGDMRQSERRRVMSDIKSGKVSILIATDVAARGIDIDDVEYVINYDIPNNVEYYIHRIGRTARAGKSGKAVSIINTKEQLIMINEYENITKSTISLNVNSANLSAHQEIKSSQRRPIRPIRERREEKPIENKARDYYTKKRGIEKDKDVNTISDDTKQEYRDRKPYREQKFKSQDESYPKRKNNVSKDNDANNISDNTKQEYRDRKPYREQKFKSSDENYHKRNDNASKDKDSNNQPTKKKEFNKNNGFSKTEERGYYKKDNRVKASNVEYKRGREQSSGSSSNVSDSIGRKEEKNKKFYNNDHPKSSKNNNKRNSSAREYYTRGKKTSKDNK